MNIQGQRLHLNAYEAIVTGFNNVLLDDRSREPGESLHGRSALAALETVGDRYEISQLKMLATGLRDRAYSELSAPNANVSMAFWWLLQRAGVVGADDKPHPDDILVRRLAEVKAAIYRDLIACEAQPIPGVPDFFSSQLPRLRGRLAIASAARKLDILTFCRFVQPGIFYDEKIFGVEDTQHPKPHREVFERAIASVGITDTLVQPVLAIVHDPQGVQSARDAGASYVLGLTTRFTHEELMGQYYKPDGTMKDFRGLLPGTQ